MSTIRPDPRARAPVQPHLRLGVRTAAVQRWWWSPFPAERIAALRLITGLFAWVYVVVRSPSLLSATDFSRQRFEPIGPLGWLDAPPPDFAVYALLTTCIASGPLLILGWRHHVSGPIFAFAFMCCATYRSSWGMVFHTENILAIHLWVLAIAPSADRWSLDTRSGRSPGADVVTARAAQGYYGWSVRTLCLTTVLTYVLAGWAKIEYVGMRWITGEAMQMQIAYDNVRKLLSGASYSELGMWLAPHQSLLAVGACLTLGMELLAPVALFGPRLGWLWCLSVWVFHVAVLVLMAILFPYQLSGAAYVCFLRPESWHRLRRPLNRYFGPTGDAPARALDRCSNRRRAHCV
ncbi:MAG: hypothetical protein V3V08_20860 [Nannocystaceae bacterium]